MKNRYFVNILKMVVGLTTGLFCAVIAVTLLCMNMTWEWIPFLIIAAIFLVVGLNFASVVSIEEDGIRRSLLGRTLKFLPWDRVREVGVTGTKVFGNTEKHTGTRYIYISPRMLSEDDQFNMILQWPPKEQIYLEYSPRALQCVQMHWSEKVKTYRAGELFF